MTLVSGLRQIPKDLLVVLVFYNCFVVFYHECCSLHKTLPFLISPVSLSFTIISWKNQKKKGMEKDLKSQLVLLEMNKDTGYMFFQSCWHGKKMWCARPVHIKSQADVSSFITDVCEWLTMERERQSVSCKRRGKQQSWGQRWAVAFHSRCCAEAAAVPSAPLQPSTNPHRLFFSFSFLSLSRCKPQEAMRGSKRFTLIGSEQVQCSITCSRDLRCRPNRTRSHPAL